MANKKIRPNRKVVSRQRVKQIGAFQVNFQSWLSNSTCLKIDRLKGMCRRALPSIKMTPYRVSKLVFFRFLSEN